MKIAYFGYDLFFPCLKRILKDGDIEVLKVFSFPENEDDKNGEVKKLADENNIEFTTKKVTKSDIESLVKRKCDLLVCAGYAYKIPVYNGVCGINMHPALLPVGRGGWPMPVTILKGLRQTGLTIHCLTENFDDGKILAQKIHVLKKDENLVTLNKWFTDNCGEMMYDCIVNIKKYLENAKPQGDGEYWKIPVKADMTVDENTDFDTVDRIARAFYNSGIYFSCGENEIKIKRAFVSKNEKTGYKSYKINGGFLIAEEF